MPVRHRLPATPPRRSRGARSPVLVGVSRASSTRVVFACSEATFHVPSEHHSWGEKPKADRPAQNTWQDCTLNYVKTFLRLDCCRVAASQSESPPERPVVPRPRHEHKIQLSGAAQRSTGGRRRDIKALHLEETAQLHLWTRKERPLPQNLPWSKWEEPERRLAKCLDYVATVQMKHLHTFTFTTFQRINASCTPHACLSETRLPFKEKKSASRKSNWQVGKVFLSLCFCACVKGFLLAESASQGFVGLQSVLLTRKSLNQHPANHEVRSLDLAQV